MEKIDGIHGKGEEYEFKVYPSDTIEEFDEKKEAKKIYDFIDNHVCGLIKLELRKIYKESFYVPPTNFILKLKTDKICKLCNKKMVEGEVAAFKRSYGKKYFEIRHLLCALKYWYQRLCENLNAEAPQIIIDDFCKIIGQLQTDILKETTKKGKDAIEIIKKEFI